MGEINNVLNYPGKFQMQIGEDILEFPGVLIKRNDTIYLRGTIETQFCCQINWDVFVPQIWGSVCGESLMLLNSQIKIETMIISSTDFIFKATAEQITLGKKSIHENSIKQIRMVSVQLNHFFSEYPFYSGTFKAENGCIFLAYKNFPDILLEDQYGKIYIRRVFQLNESREHCYCDVLVNIEYVFTHPIGRIDSVAKLAAIRNLFSYFANQYIPLENITCVDDQDEEFSLFLNWKEHTMQRPPYFLITDKDLGENFQSIWNKWLLFYHEAKPVSELFYELICDKSHNVNQFLNLSQALEVYSCHFRKDEALQIMKASLEQIPADKRPKKPKVCLNHRLEDMMGIIAAPLNIELNQRGKLALNLSDMRNYFTHYDGRRNEPTYEQLSSGSILLEFLLLSVIYDYLGIGPKSIKKVSHLGKFSELKSAIDELETYVAR